MERLLTSLPEDAAQKLRDTLRAEHLRNFVNEFLELAIHWQRGLDINEVFVGDACITPLRWNEIGGHQTADLVQFDNTHLQ